jgi:hypothetical protein
MYIVLNDYTRNHHSQETRSAMDNTMKTVVGKGEGGLTDFENMNRSSKINNSRCYSLATTVEKQTKICAPAAAGKKAGNFEQYNKVTSQVVQVS